MDAIWEKLYNAAKQVQDDRKISEYIEAGGVAAAILSSTDKIYTGVCIEYRGRRVAFCQTTQVQFYPLSEKEIADYVASGEPFVKAGAYGIQGPAALFVEGIVGDYNNIFGLPAAHVMREVKALLGE